MGLSCNRSTSSKYLSAASSVASLCATSLAITSSYFLLEEDSQRLPNQQLRVALATSLVSVIVFSCIAAVTVYDFFTVSRERRIMEASVGDARSGVRLLSARSHQPYSPGSPESARERAKQTAGVRVPPPAGPGAASPAELESVIAPHNKWEGSGLHGDIVGLCQDIHELCVALDPKIAERPLFVASSP